MLQPRLPTHYNQQAAEWHSNLSTANFTTLQSIGEVVASLRIEGWERKRVTNLLEDTLARKNILPPRAEDPQHSKAAVLDFLELFLLVLSWGVVEVERVKAALAKAHIACCVIASNTLQVALTLKPTDDNDNLN